jgi:hypothetical protein
VLWSSASPKTIIKKQFDHKEKRFTQCRQRSVQAARNGHEIRCVQAAWNHWHGEEGRVGHGVVTHGRPVYIIRSEGGNYQLCQKKLTRFCVEQQ